MTSKQNLHTHTNFSDGANTPEEMVLAAIERGFDSLGFSDHAWSVYYPEGSMRPERFPDYIAEIRRLRGKYLQIRLFAGIESDSLSPLDDPALDYVIGSVHDVPWRGGEVVCSDSESIKTHVKNARDGRYLVETYYAQVGKMLETQRVDILGHFDIVTKYNRGNALFDPDADWYADCFMSALKTARERGVTLEVNTGGMSGGRKSVPYPEPRILSEALKLGLRVTLSSDSHRADTLGFAFEDMEKLLWKIGFNELWRLA